MRVFCIRPIWTITREEEEAEDEYTDSESDKKSQPERMYI